MNKLPQGGGAEEPAPHIVDNADIELGTKLGRDVLVRFANDDGMKAELGEVTG